ncbi:ROK family transcriptional regulator [Egicoccus sp. AB-alg6-2]|uniref:ROK family transcriptional regulator n=1 Tax=Egicoccus sp. AB-alg6-2 TaxID=3242692 RepID=UPI00359D2C5B
MADLLVGPLRSVRTASGQQAREVNRRSVLHAVASGTAVTRADLARLTGLTRPTISSLIDQLVDDGLVVEAGPGESAGGKRPTLLAIDAGARQVVAIDVGTDVVVGLLSDLAGRPLASGTLHEPMHGDELVAALADLIEDLAAQASAPIAGVGIGTPGLVHADGTVVEAANLGWHDRPLGAQLQARTGLSVWVANDADAAALVEFGRLPEGRDGLALVRIGAGVGAGLVLGGRPYAGSRAAAGEVGHLVVVPDGAPCSCGNNGCLETVASLRPILAAGGFDLAHPPTDLAALLAAGGAPVRAALDLAADHLGSVVAHMIAIVDVSDVVLSVEIPGVGEALAERVRQVVGDCLLPRLAHDVDVRAAVDAEDLVLDGAHALVLAGELGMVRP